ncbi:MAG: hypothetical protein ACTJG2_03730 [Candidatus Saccharimonadales bacterium]
MDGRASDRHISYATTIGDAMLIGVNTAWMLFYGSMAVLIVYYRPRKMAAVPVPIEAQTPESR